MNPINIIQMMKNGNPQQVIRSMIEAIRIFKIIRLHKTP